MFSLIIEKAAPCVNFHLQINIVDTNRNLKWWVVIIREIEEGVFLWFSAPR